ncbi:Serine-aspartate repeat-containing protein D precursor [Stieleria maiorica]|uniref:Serine-aspartate repeat-containing protein D n=1 Tax=Stieleria maiorica TaxID=2795974 RepID=A0A5B9MB37_9BACT|nr:ELWxxDGT repeat protein [Stieleria maiorica]QEF98368.1 Serine-aspartate repeat-containing protein D precursor [Stieleria maiorica]
MKRLVWGQGRASRERMRHGRLRIETLEKRQMLAAAVLETALLRDLNPQAPPSGAQQFVAVGDRLFFVADDGLHGKELFVIDGDGPGILVKDIGPGDLDGEIGDLTAVGETLFFTAYTDPLGEELWKSDGTEAGTMLVRDINPTVTSYEYDGVTYTYGDSSFPTRLTAAGDRLFFVANDGAHGNELWISDGTESGTVLVADLTAGEAGSAPDQLTFAATIDQGTLFFSAQTPNLGRELWKSDLQGVTALVANVFPETNADGTPLFVERTDGDNKPVIRNASGKPIVGQLDAGDNWVFFEADGTQVLPSDFGPFSSNPQNLVVFDGLLYFSADGVPSGSGAVGRELWASDGTAAGTIVAGDLAAGEHVVNATDVTGASVNIRRPMSSSPGELLATNNRLYFAATGAPASGRELYSRGSSGSSGGGTVELLKDIFPGDDSSSPSQMTAAGDRVFFAAESSAGVELWSSDGTTGGTVLVRDIAAGVIDSDPSDLTALGNALVFTADNGVDGREVWKSDGTPEGTTLVKDIRPGGHRSHSLAQELTAVGNHVYFGASDFFRGFDVWRTDGTALGTEFVGVQTTASISSEPKHLTRVGSKLFFVAKSQEFGEELWVSDGNSFDTRVVMDINPAFVGNVPQGAAVSELVEFNGWLYFVAFDGTESRLWKTDGSTGGTTYATLGINGDPVPGPNAPSDLIAIGDTLFFTADESASGREVWALQATTGQATLLKDIDPTAMLSSQPLDLTRYGDRLYFSAYSPGSGRELWSSDGTPEGTVQRADLYPGSAFPFSSNPEQLVVSGGKLFFVAEDPDHGAELWVIDSDSDDPRLVADLDEGTDSSWITSLTPFDDGVVFRRDDNFNGVVGTNIGNELWISDGSAAGTRPVVDLETGTDGSRCFGDYVGRGIIEFANKIVFRANDLEHGCELFISDGTAAGTGLLEDLFEDSPIVIGEEGRSSDPDDFHVIGNALYFQATDQNGRDLWRLDLDGTLQRATFDYDFNPRPAELTIAGSNLFMIGNDGVRGREIYQLPLEHSLTPAVMEVLAKDIAYEDWVAGQTVSFSDLGYGPVSTVEFTVDTVFEDPVTGFDAVGLVSSSVGPVLAIRGSVDFLTDWFDDFHPDGVGTGQFLAAYDTVAAWLSVISASHGRPSIVGHSLGGGLTQLMAARYTSDGGDLSRVVTFNAPGIHADYAAMFDALRTEQVLHFVTNGDPVSLAGDAFLSGDWVRSTFSAIDLSKNHTHPVLVPFTYTGDTRTETRDRPDDTHFEYFDDTEWLNHPLYFHDDLNYLTWLSVMYAVANASDTLRPYRHLPASLLFRSTTEAQRQAIGQVWHDFQTPVLAAIGPTPCDPELEPFTLADMEINVLGVFDVEATGMMASCRPSPDPSVWLQGEVRLPDFFNVTANFTDENRIQLANGKIDLVGRVTAEDIRVLPGVLTVKQAGIGFDTIANTLDAGARLDIKPWGIELGVDLGFLNNQWNSIEILADGLGIPVPVLPAAFLQRVSGSVDHFAPSDPTPITFGGAIGMTLGPEVSVDLPDWAGGPVEAKLLGFDGSASFNSRQLTIGADLSIVNGLAIVDGTTTWDWVDGTLEASGGFNVLNGTILSDDASFAAHVDENSGLNLNASASATFTVPEAFPVIGGTEAFAGQFFLQFTDDGDFSNDSTGAYASFPLPLIGDVGLGFRVWLDGGIGLIGAEEIAELIEDGEGELPAQITPFSHQVMIESGKEWTLFSAQWDNETDAEIVLTTPAGATLTEADIIAATGMSIVDDLSNRKRRVVVVSQPESGVWSLSVDGNGNTGHVDFFAGSSNSPPEGVITQVAGGGFGQQVSISYDALDIDNDASIAFYYDSDSDGLDGILIQSGIAETDESGQLTWDTNGVPDGSYFVYMTIDDGINAPVSVYSQDSVTVANRRIDGRVFNDANANTVWDEGELPVADVAVFVDANGNGTLDDGEAFAITQVDGGYRLADLPVGNHTLTIVKPQGYIQSAPLDGMPQEIEVGQQDQIQAIDLGIRITPASISGVVWQDVNRDGFRDASEQWRESVSLRLIDEGSGVAVAHTVTAQDGGYEFSGIIPGSYRLEVVPETVDQITLNDRPGSDDHDSNFDPVTALRQVDLATGQTLSSIDVGLFSRWNSIDNPYDTDLSGAVTPLDALVVINFLARLQASQASGEALPAENTFPDVNGNSRVSPLDALLVINYVALQQEMESESVRRTGGTVAASSLLAQFPLISSTPSDRERSGMNLLEPAVIQAEAETISAATSATPQNVMRFENWPAAESQADSDSDDETSLDDLLTQLALDLSQAAR